MRRFSIIVTVLILAYSCEKKTPIVPAIENPVGALELLESYDVDVPEPSGLSFGPGNNTLLTVSDHTNKVYELTLQGEIIRVLDYIGKDLEGVTYNPDKNLIVVAEEAERDITTIDYETGNKVETYPIEISFGSANSGLEGISYNKNSRMYYIVNETNPDLLILWSPEYGIISETKLNFASDYSGIFIDESHSLIWMVSDQSRALYKCDYNASVIMTYYLDDLKYEGVVIDNDVAYLINDATGRLNIYKTKEN
jgi:uncharacterized protein YjiK